MILRFKQNACMQYKRSLLMLVVFVLMACPVALQAQIIKGEVMAGFNLSQVDGDLVYGYKRIGGNLGVGAMIPVKKNWDVSLETSFNQKGAYQKPQYLADSLNGAYELRLNYVEVPVLLHYTDKEFITVGAGISWGRLVGAKEYEHGRRTPTTATNGVYNLNDYCVLLDLRMRIIDRLKFNFRYQYTLASIRTREFTDLSGKTETRKQFNNVLTFRLVYVFNEPISNEVKQKKPK